MRRFVIFANKAVTSPFNLNDLPGSAGRMDIVCRFISQALFISHGIRRDVDVYAVLKGKPDPVKVLRFEGRTLRYLSPDEKSIGGMINKALRAQTSIKWREISPGVWISKKEIGKIIEELSGIGKIYYLREDGKDVESIELSEPVFIIGDHLGLSEEDERVVLKVASEVISLGGKSYQADQCVTILNYILDRRRID